MMIHWRTYVRDIAIRSRQSADKLLRTLCDFNTLLKGKVPNCKGLSKNVFKFGIVRVACEDKIYLGDNNRFNLK
jgi:hypothetical protein